MLLFCGRRPRRIFEDWIGERFAAEGRADFLRTGETFAAEGRAEFLGLCPWVKKGSGGDILGQGTSGAMLGVEIK